MTSAPRHRFTAIASVATSAVLALAGCGEDAPTQAGTIDDPSGAAGNSETSGRQADKGQEDADLSAAGERLTKAQIKAAIPPVGVLPAGWSVDPEETLTGDDENDESDDVVRPKRCAVVFESLDELDATEPAAEGGVTYMAGMLGPFLGVEISSYEDEVPDDQFAQVLGALGKCPKFSVDDGESVAKFQATSLSFPNYGEESLALRMTGTADDFAFAMDFVAIRVGHNIVGLTQMGIGGPAAIAPLKRAAKATMTNLNES